VALWAAALYALIHLAAAGQGVAIASLERPRLREPAGTSLRVPIVEQTPEHCGQAALEMVLRYYDASPAAILETASAYDPVLRGSLITDLAAAARRAGFDARVATIPADSLIEFLAAGVPPIVLYQNGRAPFTVPHFGVVTAWDAAHRKFTLNEGRAHPRDLGYDALVGRWRTAGSQALIIRRPAAP
jgi:ABC-type bacteriocin/lantibiotic exporter with double-glycine peptidase domain